MAALTLERGQPYTPPQACAFCGDRRAAYLARVRATPAEDAEHVFRYIFQCCGCHATRVVRLRSTDGGGEPAGGVRR